MSPRFKQKKFMQPVIYQIYPRSFQDSNGDGIGDLPGIIARLPYLASLGVELIWLCPIYQSPNDDNGYDISHYQKIMPEFGTLADFDRLIDRADQLGIGVIMDLVVNHTSDEHDWFVQARSSKDNPYRDYYIWKDPAGYDRQGRPLAPTNWISAFSPSAWQWDQKTQQFYLHLFSPKQPDLNWENPQVRQEVYEIMRFWLDRGVAGFRMDVINLLSKAEPYRDDPAVKAGSQENSLALLANGPRIHEFLQEMNREVLSHYDVITVGETPWTTTADGLAYSGFERQELNMIFHFEHMELDSNPDGYGKWSDRKADLRDIKKVLARWQLDLNGKAWNSLYWNNHDQPRAVSRFGNDTARWRKKSAKMLALALHCMQGTPYIYQGEELGMTNVRFRSSDDYRDLEIHNAWQQYVVDSQLIPAQKMLDYIAASGRDNARTPMQWSAQAYAGFSDVEPWIGLNPNYQEINAEQALADPDSIFHFYRQLIQLRRDYPLLITGGFELLDDPEDPQDQQVFAYLRTGETGRGQQELLVICNFSDQPQERSFFKDRPTGELLLSNYPDDTGQKLRPYEAKLYLYQLG